MPRLTRQPLVALLAALAALLAPLGATAAGSVAVAARQAVTGATTQTTSQAPPGRVTAGRELRDTAVRRGQDGGSETESAVTAGSERAGDLGLGHAPVGALAAAVLLVAVAWWVRRDHADTALVGRTTGIRSGRGPPAPACA